VIFQAYPIFLKFVKQLAKEVERERERRDSNTEKS
jgi:hypothetical protein